MGLVVSICWALRLPGRWWVGDRDAGDPQAQPPWRGPHPSAVSASVWPTFQRGQHPSAPHPREAPVFGEGIWKGPSGVPFVRQADGPSHPLS